MHKNAVCTHVRMEKLSVACVLCNAKLSVVKQPPEEWYKDVGGKNACLELAVKLENYGNVDLRSNTQVPINAVLLYKQQFHQLYVLTLYFAV